MACGKAQAIIRFTGPGFMDGDQNARVENDAVA
jgi:hypothetical protein